MRLIDADVLSEEIDSWGMNDYEPLDFIDAIDDAPTVEAIPKADYEARLKADMVAMLTELQLEIEDLYPEHQCSGELTGFADAIETITPIIQQKINSLKEA
jgi:hypothetical protein